MPNCLCKVPGCSNDSKWKGLCVKHYTQMRRHGRILDKTRFDKNDVVVHQDYAEIILVDSTGTECGRTLVDLDDLDNVTKYKWCISQGYAFNTKLGLMHRVILDCPRDKVVDHINHNKLDNRKKNIRVCTVQQNLRNLTLRKDNTSGCTGVTWDKRVQKWFANIRVDKKIISLGYYTDLEEAIQKKKNAEIEYFGEYRNKSK